MWHVEAWNGGMNEAWKHVMNTGLLKIKYEIFLSCIKKYSTNMAMMVLNSEVMSDNF
jgi:hypothetical protein